MCFLERRIGSGGRRRSMAVNCTRDDPAERRVKCGAYHADLQTTPVGSANADASGADEKSIASLGGFPGAGRLCNCVHKSSIVQSTPRRETRQPVPRRLASAGRRRQHGDDARSLVARVK